MEARVTESQLREYRALERDTWESIAAEFQAMGYNLEGSQLSWAADEFRRLMTLVGSGRVRVRSTRDNQDGDR